MAYIGYNLGPCEPPHPTMSNNLLHMDGTGRAWRPMEVHKGPRRFMEDNGGPQRPTEVPGGQRRSAKRNITAHGFLNGDEIYEISKKM